MPTPIAKAILRFCNSIIHGRAANPNKAKEYGRDDFGSPAAWVAALDPLVGSIEVLTGPALSDEKDVRSAETHEGQYFEYLNLGFHVAPTAGQDNHYITFGTITDARTAIVADNLTKHDLLAALRARHVYATEDKNLKIIFKANGHLMGDRVAAPAVGSDIDLTVSISDADEPQASYRVEVYSDVPGGDPAKSPADATTVNGNVQDFHLEPVQYRKPEQYVLLKVVQVSEDGANDRAWTAPVWFGSEGVPVAGASPSPTAPAPSGGLRIASLIPDPPGSDAENESITLHNGGADDIALAGWTLRDEAGQTWKLDALGKARAGKDVTIKRSGQPMSLNNDGDTIELVNPSGASVQTVEYGSVSTGQVVTAP